MTEAGDRGRLGARRSASLVGLAGLITAAMAVSTVLQFALGALAPHLIAEFGLSRMQLGTMTAVFYLVAATLSPAAGAVTDRMGGRRALALLFLVDAVAFLGLGFVPGYASFLVLVGFAGTAVGLGNPATNLLVASHFPPRLVGGIVGVKQSGVQMASLFSGVVLVPVAAAAGWRSAMLVVAVVAAVGFLGCGALPPDPGGGASRRRAGRAAPTTRRLLPYAFFMGMGMAAVTTYLVLYAYEAVGLTQPEAGALVGLLGACGVIARVAWSHWSQRHAAVEGPLGAMAVVATAATLLVVAALPLGGWLLWPAAAMMGASAAGWTGVAMLAVMREAGQGRSGRDAGYVLSAFYAGLLTMPVLFGALVDATGSYLWSWAATVGCFVTARLVLLPRFTAVLERSRT